MISQRRMGEAGEITLAGSRDGGIAVMSHLLDREQYGLDLRNYGLIPQHDQCQKNPAKKEKDNAQYVTLKLQHPSALVRSERQNALFQLEEVLNTFPSDQKEHYLTASRTASREVLNIEVDPLRFVRYYNGDIRAAAERLCYYWKARYEIFPPHLAALPLTLDPNSPSALQEGDIAVLKAGFPAIMANTLQGQPAIYFDRSRWSSSAREDSFYRLRALFYLVSHVLAQDNDPSNGCLFFHNIVPQQGLVPVDYVFADNGIRYIMNAFPIHVHPHGLCMLPPGGASSSTLMDNATSAIADIVSYFYGPHGSKFQVDVHFEINPGDICRAIMAQGIPWEGVPSTFGGGWDLDCSVEQWYQDQLQQQQQPSFVPVNHKDATGNVGPLPLFASAAGETPIAPIDPPVLVATPHPKTHLHGIAGFVGDMLLARAMPEAQKEYCINALREFDKAMEHVPLDKKREYLEALQKVPSLVATESDPLQFIRYCDYNFWLAAERMCNYWMYRRELFQQRAHLPMTIDGTGALDDTDVLYLSAGWPALLPKTTCGRYVVLFDPSKQLNNVDRNCRRRASFYCANLIAKDERAQTPKGVVFLVNLIQPRMHVIDLVFSEKGLSKVDSVFPIRFDAHFLCKLPKTMRGTIREVSGGLVTKQAYIYKLISFCSRPRGQHFQPVIHYESEDGQFLRALMGLGMRKEDIPKCFGGTWSFAQARMWCKNQVKKEKEQRDSRKLRKRKKAEGNDNCGGGSKWTTQRQRTINAIHSRKKRERRRQEEEMVKQESKKLAKTNAYLKEENCRLQALLEEAYHHTLAE